MREVKNKKIIPLRYVVTMLIVVVGWVFFRSPGLRYALRYVGVMFGLVQPEFAGFTVWYYLSPKIIFVLCLAAVASTPVLKLSYSFLKDRIPIIQKQIAYGLILTLFFVCIIFVTASSYNPFIYFRF
jgi:alginate O-acetyltransferase complex protein AlgI